MKPIDGGRMKRQQAKRAMSWHPGDASDTLATSGFAVPPQDARGNSDKVMVRIPPAFTRMFDILKNKPALRFKTQSDVVRAAVKEGLDVLCRAADDPTLSNLQSVTNGWLQVCQQEEEMANFQHTIDTVTGTVNKLLSMNAQEKAQALVRRMLRDCRSMDDKF